MPALTQALVAAGLDRAMISLHGSTAEISDAVTGAPGTFVGTVRGIDELVRTGVPVRLNFVFCQQNRDDFPRFVDFVAGALAQGRHRLLLRRLAHRRRAAQDRAHPALHRGHAVAPRRLGEGARWRASPVYGFDSMCGLPLCLVPEAERAGFSTLPVAADGGGGEFVKAEVCARCSEGHRCYGVRRGYAELYGTSELQPLSN